MTFAGEAPRDAVLVGGRDDVVVAHTAARLDDRADAGRSSHVPAVAEREESIAGAHAAMRLDRLNARRAMRALSTPVLLAGADAERLTVLGVNDGVAADCSAHGPCECQVVPLRIGRSSGGDDGPVRAIEVDLSTCWPSRPPSTERTSSGVPYGAGPLSTRRLPLRCRRRPATHGCRCGHRRSRLRRHRSRAGVPLNTSARRAIAPRGGPGRQRRRRGTPPGWCGGPTGDRAAGVARGRHRVSLEPAGLVTSPELRGMVVRMLWVLNPEAE